MLTTIKGLLKMYDAEVLSKFPVVQHFPFGSLLKWEQIEGATAPVQNAHTWSMQNPTSMPQRPMGPPMTMADATQGPWVRQPTMPPMSSRAMGPPTMMPNATQAPWVRHPMMSPMQPTGSSGGLSEHRTRYPGLPPSSYQPQDTALASMPGASSSVHGRHYSPAGRQNGT